MGKDLGEIEKDIKKLSLTEKELLIDDLIMEIDSKSRVEIDILREQLVKSRYDDVVEGRVVGVDGNFVVKKIKSRLNEKNRTSS